MTHTIHELSQTYSDTLFVSSGGGGEPAQRSSIAIDILGKALVDVNISVLLDRDFASGKTTTQTDRDIYLKNNPKKHRVLRRWELENYLYDKEVLRQYSKQYDLEFDGDTFDDKIANIVDGDVKGLTGLIKNICGVKGNVSPKTFKIELSKLITPEMEVYKELESCIFY